MNCSAKLFSYACDTCSASLLLTSPPLGGAYVCPGCGREVLVSDQPKAKPTTPLVSLGEISCRRCGVIIATTKPTKFWICPSCGFDNCQTHDDLSQSSSRPNSSGPRGLNEIPVAFTLPPPAPYQPIKAPLSNRLIALATKNLFRQNSFRIIAIPVDSTGRQIARQAEKHKMLQELGHGGPHDLHIFPFTPSPAPNDIREALQQLNDPEHRILDELFWFWPAEFGRHSPDPAIQALLDGNTKHAILHWQDLQYGSPQAHIARHNLAVFWHMTALESEHRSTKESIDETTMSGVQSYWKTALRYWEHVLCSDDTWEIVADRIRQIDDPRLPTGYARRIRASLPQALDKINAEVVLGHIAAGNFNSARFHVNLMVETSRRRGDITITANIILEPASYQLREQITAATLLSNDDPSNANEAAHALLRSSQPLLEIFEAFHGKGHTTRDDMFDEVAATCLTCAIAHQCATGDDESLISLLGETLNLAASEDLRIKIKKGIDVGKGNIVYSRLLPLREKLSEIMDSKDSISGKLLRLREEVLPSLRSLESGDVTSQGPLSGFFSEVGWAYRSLSIAAHNDDGDTELALEIIRLARQFAREPDLQEKIANDIKELTQVKQNQDSQNLILTIREDQLEITRAGFRYNDQFIRAEDITAIRFGRGVFDLYCHIDFFALGIRGTGADEINVDFKRILRSKEQAHQDQSAAIAAIYYHCMPRFFTRLAKRMIAGHEEQLGDCWLTSYGVRGIAGALLWKSEVHIPWSDVRYEIRNGQLLIRSSKDRDFFRSYDVRNVWNAAIFEEIVNAVSKIRT